MSIGGGLVGSALNTVYDAAQRGKDAQSGTLQALYAVKAGKEAAEAAKQTGKAMAAAKDTEAAKNKGGKADKGTSLVKLNIGFGSSKSTYDETGSSGTVKSFSQI